jgi:ribosomal protein S6 kinase alpha-5
LEEREKEIEKSKNEDENKDEMEEKFEENPFLLMSKKNVRESFMLNNDFVFQNILISQDKLNSLSTSSNIPPFNETDYNYLKPIGEGTYGIVYLVENNETHEQFALKKIVCRDYNELIKHKNELELIYSVKHENILKICGIHYKYLDETTSSIFVLMELAKNDWNMEIKRRIIAKKYYKENEIVDILKQIIKGFLFLQEKSIAHRDIKPQNILLFPNNVYKIADFGEAKNIKNISQQSTLRGSELYMSPSLYKGYKFNQKNVLHNPYKSDVFSLGYCFLYAICLNLKVLEAVRELTTMRSIISTINKYIVKNKYSDKLMNLLYKMINPNESERLDFEDLSIELDNF